MKNGTVLLLILFAGIAGNCQQSAPDCNAFHTGNYLYTDTAGHTWELKRTRNRQTEKDLKTGKHIKYRIRWISACEYRLTQVWSDIRERRKWNRMHFSYLIVKTTGNAYEYTCVCKGSPSMQGKVVRQ